MKKILLVVAVVVLYVLHQDIWFWRSSYLVFGFIPIGLFYQGCFSVAAALLMWLLVTYAWPSHLEQEVEETKYQGGRSPLIPAIVVFLYLAIVLYIGIFAFRRAKRKRGS